MADLLFWIGTGLAVSGLLLTLWRLLKGPWAIDRTVALDAMTIVVTSLIAAFAYLAERKIYLDVAMVYALVGFTGVVVIARYLEGDL